MTKKAAEAKKATEEKKSVAEVITDRFVKALEGGMIPWVKPWEMWKSWSRNTGNDYQGVNQLLLSGGEYLTFKQAKAAGIKINKGAKAERIVKYTEYKKTITAEQFEEYKKWFPASMKEQLDKQVERLDNGKVKVPAKSVRYYNVFNVEAFTDAEVKHDKKQSRHEWNAIEKAEEIIKGYTEKYNITVEHLGNSAYNRDNLMSEGGHVQLPKREQFKSAEGYYSTFFHELVHSTADYVKRDKSQYHKSNKARAREELVAEIGAAYIMSYLGIESFLTVENSNAYVRGWAENLKSDPKAVLWAAPKAIEAAELILNK